MNWRIESNNIFLWAVRNTSIAKIKEKKICFLCLSFPLSLFLSPSLMINMSWCFRLALVSVIYFLLICKQIAHRSRAVVREETVNFPLAAGKHVETAKRNVVRKREKKRHREKERKFEGVEMVRENSWWGLAVLCLQKTLAAGDPETSSPLSSTQA